MNITKGLSVVLVLIMVLMLSNVVLCVLMMGYEPEPAAPQGGGLGFDPSAQNKRPDVSPDTPSQSVSIAGFSELTIPPDTDAIAIDLYNPEDNFGLYYLTFELRLVNDDNTVEVLYTSGLVGAGQHIYQITLAHGLPAGEYNAVLFIQPYRMADRTPTNNVAGNVKIIVK